MTDVTYSSTEEPSSDDRSSVNSVIFVETVPEVDSDFEHGPPPPPPLRDPRDTYGGLLACGGGRDSDHLVQDSSDSDTSLDERHETDSTSSSDGSRTQVWVASSGGKGGGGSGASKSSGGASGASCGGLRNSVIHNNAIMMRSSIVSQNSSGKVETSVISEEVPFNGDSGISNESPETHSSAEHHLHLHGAGVLRGPHQAHLLALPAPSPPASPAVTKGSGNRNGDAEDHPIINQTEMDALIRENLFNILSGLYALLLVIMGVALPISEIFAEPVKPGVFEGFYIYLFGVSVAFLLYVYVFLLRSRTISRKCWQDKVRANDTLLRKARRSIISVTNHSHTGSFYLRLGAVGFGIGAMIHEGLIFGGLFEVDLKPPCLKLSEAARPALHLCFTFIQLYFIFLNSKMYINRYKIFARFGLMHMLATNVCVWLHTVIFEIVREIHEQLYDTSLNDSAGHVLAHVASNRSLATTTTMATTTTTTRLNVVAAKQPAYVIIDESSADALSATNASTNGSELTAEPPVECNRHDLLGSVVEAASPYLYPCTIQYSLVATGILYVMWRNIGGLQRRKLQASGSQRSRKNHIHVDCSGANRGLFFGIFTLVAAIIGIIVFFVLVERPQYVQSAILVIHVVEVALYTLALIAIIFAFYKIRDMRFHSDRDNSLDETLLVVALMGQIVWCVFTVMAGHYSRHTFGGVLVMATGILILLEAIVQTVFILNGLRRSPLKPYHESKKPGREYITYLLVVNIAMWAINTFEVLRADSNPVALNFYGVLLWSIISHVSTPLVIFYRFHSTVCLANIWKNAYKLKVH